MCITRDENGNSSSITWTDVNHIMLANNHEIDRN